jgi:FAD/FMN-containing dehydrogenase
MSLVMPDLNQNVLSRRDDIIKALRRIVPGDGVITAASELRPYESDGLTAYRQPPMVVVLPETVAQVSAVLAFCYAEGVKVVPRGGALQRLGEPEADAFWDAVRHVAPLADGRPLWRVHVPPSSACGVVAVLESLGARWLIDWAGGLVWLSFDGDPRILRQTAEDAGGYATLVRAPAELRAVVPMQHPRPRGVMALEARVRRAFDPSGVFESGRFLDHNDAN